MMVQGFVLYEQMLRDERRRANDMQEEFSRVRKKVKELEELVVTLRKEIIELSNRKNDNHAATKGRGVRKKGPPKP
jgi:chromosome segregation ATPase